MCLIQTIARPYNGTSTISLQAGPATDIPTSIQKSNDNVIIIHLDPESVGNHFGNLPIYGLTINAATWSSLFR